MSEPELMFMDADDFASNNKPCIVILNIRRSDVEKKRIGSVMERLHILTDSAEKTRLYRDSVVISVEGYDDDLRELVDIPEVRAFFARLTDDWPHWLWFLNREFGSVGLLLALLCQVRVIHTDAGFGTEFVNNKEVTAKIRDLLSRGTALFTAYDISDAEATDSANSLFREFS